MTHSNIPMPVAGLIGNLFVDAFEGFKFAQNTAIPFVEMKTPVNEPVNARQVVVGQELECIGPCLLAGRHSNLQP